LIRILIAAATIAALGSAAGAIAAGLPDGLNQLQAIPGNAATDGCISRIGSSEPPDGAGTCTDGTSVDNSYDVTISPDGKHVYSVKGTGSDAFDGVSAFTRDPTTGVLTQLGGTAACTTSAGSTLFDGGGGTCENGRALRDPRDIEISPDGKHAYVAGSFHRAIALFDRDATTGDLDQLSGNGGADGCISVAGSSESGGGTCATGIEMDGVLDLDLSPDGAHLYAVALVDNSLLSFSRAAATGLLTQLTGGSSEEGCTSLTGIVGSCVDGRAVNSPNGVDVSPDGANVYTASTGSDALAAFSRNATTGVLTQLAGASGCISIDGDSEDGAGTCTDGRALDFPADVEVSPDGENVYAVSTSSQAIAILDRNPTTGALTQLAGTSGCVTGDGSSEDGAGTCGVATFPDPTLLLDLEVSADGSRVYVGGNDGVGVFERDPTTGALTQLPLPAGCVDVAGDAGCSDGRLVRFVQDLAASPNPEHVYTAATSDLGGLGAFELATVPSCAGSSAATTAPNPVAVGLGCTDADGDPITHAVASGPTNGTLGTVNDSASTVTYTPDPGFAGTDTFTYTATDGTNTSDAAIATVTVGPDTTLILALDAKGKQRVGKLAVEVGCGGEACEGEIAGGKAVAKKRAVAGADAAGKKRLKVKLKRKSFSVAAGEVESVRIKFAKHRKSLKQLQKLLKKKAFRKKSRATAKVTVTDAAGNSAAGKVKVRLKK
jgi:6-phosphogluconolactonase (cycloisomerase 2 family)